MCFIKYARLARNPLIQACLVKPHREFRMFKITMPRLSVAMKSGIIAKWYKKEGENVRQGEPLLEVETAKVVNEIEAPASGTLYKIMASEGSEVPVGELVAVITETGEEQPSVEEIEKPAAPPMVEKEMKISPLARKLAEEYKIDLTKITGTGPDGQITKEDVLRAVEEAKLTAVVPSGELLEIAEVVPLTPTRRTIAERLSQSYRDAVHVTITMDVDMTEIQNLRERLLSQVKEKANTSLSYTDILVKAVALAIRKNPIINSTLEGNKVKIIKDINIGVAVAVEEGLVVPIVSNADKKSLLEISANLKDLGEKARQHTLSLDEVTGGTFTISNLGMFDVDTFSPIINPPQSSILGVGSVKDKPVAINGQVMIKPLVTLSLVFDHRILDGAPAAVFLKTIKEILENPLSCMETARASKRAQQLTT